MNNNYNDSMINDEEEEQPTNQPTNQPTMMMMMMMMMMTTRMIISSWREQILSSKTFQAMNIQNTPILQLDVGFPRGLGMMEHDLW